jgi:hypothetical protein
MTKELLFWLIYIVCILATLLFSWPEGPVTRLSLRPLGNNLILFVLIGILGWAVFGPIVR